MRYKIKYQARGKVETYIAIATSFISELSSELFSEHELYGILQNVADEVVHQAELTTKGLTARPEYEINNGTNKTLRVYNTNGREVLFVWFEGICDKEQKLHKGDRVWFKGDKKPFRVRAANEKFAICTKPYNFQPKTVIYTIVDFEWNIRGMDNMIFGIYSYYSDEECEEALQALTNGELEVSSRTHKHTRLEIERIVKQK